MGKKTFFPNWYLDKKNIIRDKKIKICIIVVLLANIFLTATIINISKRTSILDQSSPVENNINILKTVKQDIFTIEKYKQISDFLTKSNLTYKNIIITGSNFEIDIEVRSYEEYIYVIRCIENEYSIKKLIPNIKNKENEDDFNFKVILGV
ncbi:hypothetical protein [Clostridium sp.]|uniref:hypothetical protein n=1 Tax=Clostridium sp. TaxID=1506 RepID=UPI001A3F2F59|nr:hypothetical protein [Clostridium sp.]MBK5241299.1 hypothetical protein [Clostridium sp.]